MSKKQDLFNVFNFIAEYLREEEIINGSKQLLVESKPTTNGIDDVLRKLQHPIENLTSAKGSKHIKDLMDRIETKDRETATTHQILNAQRKTFETELKKIKDEYADKLIVEKNADVTDESIIESVEKQADIILEE